jgi:ABC-type transporter Mla maintaining outer membrane lipid asymmetry ATPase subunit MlaF
MSHPTGGGLMKAIAVPRAEDTSAGREETALVGDPDLLFLDEPTTGFDPAARRQAWSLVESLKPLGKTVFLTTHYMDED